MANARLGWFSPLGVAASIRASARRVGLRAHCFRFSACTASEWPLGGLVFGLISSAFRPAPLRSGHWASSFFRLPFRRLPLGGLTFGLTASAFRHAPLRGCPRRVDSSAGRVGLRAHCFRFSACTASELPSAGWPSGSRLPLFGTRRFGVALCGLAFGLTASAFRHAPLRGCRSAGWFFCLPLRGCPRRVGLRTHRFRFSARTDSEWLLGEFVLPPSVSEIAIWRVGLRAHCFRFSARTASEWPPGGLAFGLTASAFRHAPLRKLPSAG